MHKYSKTTDLIYPVTLLSKYKELPDDLQDITAYEAQVHMGNIPAPEGQRRKPNVYPFEFEDIPPIVFPVEQLQQQAKATRDTAISAFHSTVVLDNAEFDADDNALTNINRAIRFAENNGLPETDEQDWRLADNTWRITTLTEIRELKILVEQAIDAHFKDVWSQFTAWDNGPKDKPFSVV